MVWAKVTDGREIRKLELKPEMSFNELKDKVTTLFSNLSGGDIGLRYRDTDGDTITLSTDEEVHWALGQQPPGETLYLQAIPKRRGTIRRAAVVPTREFESGAIASFGGNILTRVLDEMEPYWTPSAIQVSSWDSTDPLNRRLEERLERQMKELEKAREEQMRLFEEQRKKAEADVQKALKERKTGKGEIQKKGEPAWHVQTFGSWDPETSEGHTGRRTVIGPVGYHMYWGYSEPEEPMQQEQAGQQQKQQGEQKKEQI